MTDWPTDARACLERCREWLRDAADETWCCECEISGGLHFPACDTGRLLAAVDRVLNAQQPDGNDQPLGRLRLALKQLGDEASMSSFTPVDSRCCSCATCLRRQNESGKAEAYRHALDLVMQLEREQA